jgi:hypothetical protein
MPPLLQVLLVGLLIVYVPSLAFSWWLAREAGRIRRTDRAGAAPAAGAEAGPTG